MYRPDEDARAPEPSARPRSALLALLLVVLASVTVHYRQRAAPALALALVEPRASSCAAVEADVSVTTNTSARMRLHAHARVRLRGAGANATVAIKYYPASCARGSEACASPPLWSRAARASDGAAALDVLLVRLVPAAEYRYELHVRADGCAAATVAARGAFESLSTGFPRFDLRPLGNVTAPGGEPLARALLSVEMVMFAYAFDESATGASDGADDDIFELLNETNFTAFNASSLNASVDDASFGGDDSPPPGAAAANATAPNASAAARRLGRDARLSVNATYNASVSFAGVVAINRAGWVVWYYELKDEGMPGVPNAIGVFDFLPRAVVVLGSTLAGNSQIAQVSPLGAVELQYVNSCDGAPMDYNIMSHELRVDHTDPALPVLSTASVLRRYPEAELAVATDAAAYNRSSWGTERYRTCGGGAIVRWDRASNALATEADLFDYLDPRRDRPRSWVWTTAASACGGNATLWDVLDWTHVSSVDVGVAGNYLVTCRNLGVVLSIRRDTRALQWLLASTLPALSNYTFENDAAKFYEPHDVSQLPNGDVLLVDDGDDRPGCYALASRGYAGCFSRAIQYELDDAAGVARVRWQFEYPYQLNASSGEYGASHFVARADDDYTPTPNADLATVFTHDLFNWDGGSVARLADGHYLVAFTAVEATRDWNPSASMYAFEVDGRGKALTMLVIPNGDSTDGGYRLRAWSAIDGESPTSPFGE